MTSIYKTSVYYKPNDKVNRYNNTYHRTFKMKPIDAKSSVYCGLEVESNNRNPKFMEESM